MLDPLFSEGPIRALQGLSSPLLDAIFTAITSTGSSAFLILAVLLLYWLRDKRVAVLISVLLLYGSALNGLMKALFGMPRPPQELHKVDAGGNGFPSGHAQQSTAFWSSLALAYRGTMAAAAVVMIVLVALSRVYLGVHFLGDVLGGAAIGLLLASGTVILSARVPWSSLDLRLKVILSIAGPSIFPGALYLLGYDVLMSWGSMMGILVGYLLETRLVGLEPASGPVSVVVRLAIGLPTVAGLFLAARATAQPFLDLLLYAALGLTATLGLPLVFRGVESVLIKKPS